MIKNKNALTLIEMLAVLSIVSILFLILVPNISKAIERTRLVEVEKDFKSYADAAQIYLNKKNSGFTEESYNEYLDKQISFENGVSEKKHKFKDNYKLIFTNKSIVVTTKIKDKWHFMIFNLNESCHSLQEYCLLTIADEEVLYDPNDIEGELSGFLATKINIKVLEKSTYQHKIRVEFYPNEENIEVKKFMKGKKSVEDFNNNGTVFTNNEMILNESGIYTFYFEDSEGKKGIKTLEVHFKKETNIDVVLTEQTNWSNSSVDISYDIDSDYDVVKKLWFEGERNVNFFENEGFVSMGDSLQVFNNGTYTFYVETSDGTKKTFPFNVTKIDKTSPTITINENTSWAKSHTVNITTSDSHSGVQKAEYAWTTSVTPPTDWLIATTNVITKNNGDGTWYLHVKVTDKVGNSSSTYKERKFDNIGPMFSLNPGRKNPQNTAKVVPMATYFAKSFSPYISNSRDDGSGIAKKEYRVFHTDLRTNIRTLIKDWTTFYDSSIADIGEDGSIHPTGGYVVEVRLTDFLGQSNTLSVSANIDNTPPDITITKIHTTDWVDVFDARFSYGAYDEHSSEAEEEYEPQFYDYILWKLTRSPITEIIQPNDSNAMSYGSRVNLLDLFDAGVLKNGADNYFNFQSSDSVGNISFKSLQLKIDTIDPTLILSSDSTVRKSHTVSINASDAHSGVAKIEYAWSTSLALPTNWTTTTSNTVTKNDGNGIHYLFVRVTDKAGHQTIKHTERKFDNLAPDIMLSYDSANEAINVSFLDGSPLGATKFDLGNMDLNHFTSGGISNSTAIHNNKIYINKNGVYTFYAKDSLGNETTKKITINGIPSYNADNNFVFSTNARETYITDYVGSSKTVSIPKNLNWRPIKTIISNSFSNDALTSVTIPSGVADIGVRAFENNALTVAVIPNTVNSISEYAFYNNKLQTVNIPTSLTSIANSVFSNNEIRTVNIPNNITSIAQYAFSKNKLQTVNIPNSVTTIGQGAFSDNEITSFTLPNSITTIPNSLFSFNKITSLTLPSHITKINADAFSNNGMQNLTLPNNLVEIGFSAFYQNELTSVNFPNSLRVIDSQAFMNNLLTHVTLPNSITVLAFRSFSQNKITSVNIPTSITVLEGSVFRSNQISSINIPNNITEIGDGAFENNKLTSVTIHSNITSIGATAFRFNQLSTVTLRSAPTYGQWAFYSNNSSITVRKCTNQSNTLITPAFNNTVNIITTGC